MRDFFFDFILPVKPSASMKSKILIVEDDKNLNEVLKNLCHDLWQLHDCFFVTSVKQAIQYLEKNKPDLIFLDFYLIGETALPIIEFIRKKYPTHTPHIVMMSAMTHADKIAEENHTDFIKKPFSIENFEQYIF